MNYNGRERSSGRIRYMSLACVQNRAGLATCYEADRSLVAHLSSGFCAKLSRLQFVQNCTASQVRVLVVRVVLPNMYVSSTVL